MPAITLTPNECRVLGVLIEKAQTTPGQYPLTLNALTTGCNQKNNRDPLTDLSEDDVLDAIDGLKQKELVREAMLAGSRVNKFRHIARETLAVSTAELVILAELWLRGPQAAGELRGRASRMMPPADAALGTLESTQAILDALMKRGEPTGPLVVRLPTRPGERAPRHAQTLCPLLHPLDGPVVVETGSGRPETGTHTGMAQRIEALESEVRELKALVNRVADAVGIDPGNA